MLIDFYIAVIIIQTIISYFSQLRYQTWAKKLKQVVDFSCDPIRRLLPKDLPFDFSPLIVIILLQMIKALW